MNNEGNWNECIETTSSLQVTPNPFKSRSLVETANGRIQFLQEIEIKQSNANYIFENYYTSIAEIMHAIILLSGFKVITHICLGYYIRDILKKDDIFRLFDDCRSKRNSLVYYGKKMEFEVAQEAIKQSKALIIKLHDLI